MVRPRSDSAAPLKGYVNTNKDEFPVTPDLDVTSDEFWDQPSVPASGGVRIAEFHVENQGLCLNTCKAKEAIWSFYDFGFYEGDAIKFMSRREYLDIVRELKYRERLLVRAYNGPDGRWLDLTNPCGGWSICPCTWTVLYVCVFVSLLIISGNFSRSVRLMNKKIETCKREQSHAAPGSAHLYSCTCILAEATPLRDGYCSLDDPHTVWYLYSTLLYAPVVFVMNVMRISRTLEKIYSNMERWFMAYTSNKNFCVTWDTATEKYWCCQVTNLHDYRIPAVYKRTDGQSEELEILWATFSYKIREKVLARTSGGRWCPARVVSFPNEDNRYMIRYSNGNERYKGLHDLRKVDKKKWKAIHAPRGKSRAGKGILRNKVQRDQNKNIRGPKNIYVKPKKVDKKDLFQL